MYIDPYVTTDALDAPKRGATPHNDGARSLSGFCFGTLITTKEGPRLIETLRVGDQILTRDNGFQRLRWRTPHQAASHNEMGVVGIEAGVIGNHSALYMSRSTSVLMNTDDGLNEHLVPTRHLINDITIRATAPRFTMSLVFDRHEIILANGAFCETLRVSNGTMAIMSPDQHADLLEHLPLLRVTDRAYHASARPSMPMDLGQGLLRGNKVA